MNCRSNKRKGLKNMETEKANTNSIKAASIVNHDDDNLEKKPTGRNFDADRRLESEKSGKNYEPFLDLRV